MSDGLSARLRVSAPALALDLVLPPGATCAVMGPSGAGKTTALRALAGLLPAEGLIQLGSDVWLDSVARVTVLARRRRVGMLFQSGALFPHLTALGNVAIAGAGPAEAADLLGRVGLSGLEHRRPPQLSGGQRQRVALARALARMPELLLLDEPFAAVDPPVRRELIALVADVRRTTTAPILFVTHDIVEARALASHVLMLDSGAQAGFGPAPAMTDDAASPLRRWLDG